MNLNTAQRQYLARFGSKPFDSLPVEVRLEVANLSSVPEPVSSKASDVYTPSQRDFIGDRKVEDLSADHLELFEYLGGPTFQPKPSEEVRSVEFRIDPSKLANMQPEARLAVAEAFDIVQQARSEIAAGTHPSARRVQDGTMNSAMTQLAPFLATA